MIKTTNSQKLEKVVKKSTEFDIEGLRNVYLDEAYRLSVLNNLPFDENLFENKIDVPKNNNDIKIKFEFKLEDIWMGVFWKKNENKSFKTIDVWICFIPCFPLHITFKRSIQ